MKMRKLIFAGIVLMTLLSLASCGPLRKIKRKLANTNTETAVNPEDRIQGDITVPDYVTPDFLTVSENNRPGLMLPEVKNIVIHYVANPGTSAKANRNYFNNLSDPASNPDGISASAHFIVGLEGEVIQCIPVTEVAYANYPRNFDTISIEVCHPEADGKFSDVTKKSLVKLTAWLLKTYDLTAEDVIRHYDISGKACPLYYVENEQAFTDLKAEIEKALK